MPVLDLSPWAKRNVWRMPSGELCVRPGLRQLHVSSGVFVGGFSVARAHAQEVYHYLFEVDASPPRNLRVRVTDALFEDRFAMALGLDVVPRVITHSVVEDQLYIASPDFPPLYGLVGNRVRYAVSVPSVLSTASVLPPPRGVCCSWANRNVVADGPSIFVSDPIAATGGDARTFLAANQNNRPSPVYGLHEGAGGALLAVTADGVYALDVESAAAGVVGATGTGWRMLNHLRTQSYGSSCVIRGRLYVLTKDGWALGDVEDGPEQVLVEPLVARAFAARFALDDHRECKIHSGEHGPIVSAPLLGATHMFDLKSGLGSWWTYDEDWDDSLVVVGILRDCDGGDLLITEDAIVRPSGNRDAGTAFVIDGIAQGASSPVASVAGRLAVSPLDRARVVGLHVAAAACGPDTVRAAVRGLASDTLELGSPPDGVVLGTSEWGTGRYQPAPMQRARFQITEEPVGEVDVEVSVAGGHTRFLGSLGIVLDEENAVRRPGKSA
jgi:hypothetical protein